MATLGAGSTDVMIMGALALAGVGMGIASPSLASSVTNAVDEADFGIAGAAQQMMMQVGIVFGIQIMQTVQQVALGAGGPGGQLPPRRTWPAPCSPLVGARVGDLRPAHRAHRHRRRRPAGRARDASPPA